MKASATPASGVPGVVPIVALAIVNGIFSPFLIGVFALQGLWYPFFLPAHMGLVFALSSLLLSTVFLMISGVPAALYEFFVGGKTATLTSRLIWFAAMVLMTLPSLPNIMGALGRG